MHPPYILDDAEARSTANSESFPIPDITIRERLLPGDLVKLIFIEREGAAVERMWVEVVAVTDQGYVGRLDNDPTLIPGLAAGEEVVFEPRHVMTVWVEASHNWAERMVEVRHSFTRSRP
jgi:uncharacterized protein YegJ (DUF2314 family)